MNIPNVPTDNIYKFAAIFGLILFVGSILLFLSSDKKIHDAKIQSELSDLKQREDSLNLDFKYKIMEVKREIIEESITSPPKTLIESEYYLQQYVEQDKAFENYHKANINYSKSISENFKNETDLLFYETEQKINNHLSKVLVAFGILFIAWGFTSWYFKHQIYIDAEIKWKGETYRELLKDAKVISKSNPAKADIETDEQHVEKPSE